METKKNAFLKEGYLEHFEAAEQSYLPGSMEATRMLKIDALCMPLHGNGENGVLYH